MRDKILAVAILITVLCATGVNDRLLRHTINNIIDDINAFQIDEIEAKYEAEHLLEDYLKKEHYISLTVSHDDLTRIEEGFCEVIACLKVGDTEGAKIAKDRLIHSLEHLRRLSGFNIDSII